MKPRKTGNPHTDKILAAEDQRLSMTEEEYRARVSIERAERETRRRENLSKPTRDYPGPEQMMAWQALK